MKLTPEPTPTIERVNGVEFDDELKALPAPQRQPVVFDMRFVI